MKHTENISERVPEEMEQAHSTSEMWGTLYADFPFSCYTKGTSIPLWGDVVHIGRQPSGSLPLTEQSVPVPGIGTVSRQHCRLFKPKGSARARVLCLSQNCMCVNDVELGPGQQTVLQNGCSVMLIDRGEERAGFVFEYAAGKGDMALVGADNLLKRYRLQNSLGSGSFGSVFRAVRREDGLEVAVKVISQEKVRPYGGLAFVEKEWSNNAKSEHKNIVRVFETITDVSYYSIVMELIDGGSLFEYIVRNKRLSEDVARPLVIQIADAVAYLHSVSIIHRDLKPENIFLTKDHLSVRVGDFGLSRELINSSYASTVCGSPLYQAPEINRENHQLYSYPADAWSLGCIIFAMLTGTCPFNKDEGKVRREWRFPEVAEGTVSPAALDLIKRLLRVPAEQRLKVCDISQHPWCLGATEMKKPLPDFILENEKLLNSMGEFLLVDKDHHDDSTDTSCEEPPHKAVKTTP